MLGNKNSVTLYVIVILTLIATLLLATLLLFDQASEDSRRSSELRSTLDINADQLAASLALPVWNFDRPQLDKITDAAMKERDVYAVLVQMRDASAPGGTSTVGRVRDAAWHPIPATTLSPPPGILASARDLVADGQPVGSVKLFATPGFMREDLSTHLLYAAIRYGSVGIVLIAFLYLLLWHNILKPVQKLERYASAISAGRQPDASALQGTFRGELEKLRFSMEHMLTLLNSRYTSLQQNQAMLFSVLDSVPQSIFWKDRNSVYLGGNGAFAKTAGLPNAEAVVGKTDFDMPWADTALVYREDDRTIISSGVTRSHFTALLKIAGGQSIWIEATKSPLRDRDGATYGVLGVYEDISSRRLAEQALHRQAQFNEIANRILSGLVGNTSAALKEHLCNSLGDIARFMESQYAFIAEASEDFTTWSYTHEWRDEGVPSYLAEHQNMRFGMRTWAEGKVLEGQVIHIQHLESLPPEAAAMRQYWESRGFKSILSIPLRGAGGVVRGTVGLFCLNCPSNWTEEDIQRIKLLADAIANTLERQHIQIALKDSEARFRLLIEHAPMAISISREGKWLYFNSAYIKMFELGSREEAMARQNMFDHIAPEYRQDVRNRVRLRGEKRPVSDGYECMAILPDGTRFPYYIEVATVEFSDGPASVAFLTNLTDRRRSQALLIESEKLRTVAGLASGVAHEINNPLAGMVQNAQVVLNRLTQDTPANRETAERHGTTFQAIRAYISDRDIPGMIETIRASGRQASRIVQNLLAYSRQDAPKSIVSLSDLVERTLELAAGDFELRKMEMWPSVEIIRDFATPAPWVPVYTAQIQQVLLNLIRNAVQAMRSNPANAPKQITLRTYSENGFGCLSVEDTGPGIPPEIERKIFEPFFTTKPEGEGTGLGLFVSYHIIRENHAGFLTVNSTPGKGARFILRLPREADRPPALTQAAPPNPPPP